VPLGETGDVINYRRMGDRLKAARGRLNLGPYPEEIKVKKREDICGTSYPFQHDDQVTIGPGAGSNFRRKQISHKQM